MCTVLLPPGGYPIAVNRYIIKQPGALSKCQQRELCVECSMGHLFNVTRRGVFGGWLWTAGKHRPCDWSV